MEDSVLKALCEPNRYRILCLIQQRGYCVAALAHASGLSESSVSQHLKILREAGLVQGEKRGFYTHYTLNRDALKSVIGELNELTVAKPKPCYKRPYYGCAEAEYVQCKAYIPPEKR
jgi:ArsR family transcriptional regulator